MIYENYAQVTTKVAQIKQKQDLLKELSGEFEVRITGANNRFNIITIGDCEHEFSPFSRHLVESIRMDLEAKIARLKDELKEL